MLRQMKKPPAPTGGKVRRTCSTKITQFNCSTFLPKCKGGKFKDKHGQGT